MLLCPHIWKKIFFKRCRCEARGEKEFPASAPSIIAIHCIYSQHRQQTRWCRVSAGKAITQRRSVGANSTPSCSSVIIYNGNARCDTLMIIPAGADRHHHPAILSKWKIRIRQHSKQLLQLFIIIKRQIMKRKKLPLCQRAVDCPFTRCCHSFPDTWPTYVWVLLMGRVWLDLISFVFLVTTIDF